MNCRIGGLLRTITGLAITTVGFAILNALVLLGAPDPLILLAILGYVPVAGMTLSLALLGWLEFVSGVPFAQLSRSWDSRTVIGKLAQGLLVVSTLLLSLALLAFGFVELTARLR